MAKAKTIYSCTECGGQTAKWQGQCPHCEAWNTLEEGVGEPTGAAAAKNRFQALTRSQPASENTVSAPSVLAPEISQCAPAFSKIVVKPVN